MPNRPVSKLNFPAVSAFNAGPADAEIASSVPVALGAISAPTNLSLSTANEQSAITPTSLIQVTWRPPTGVAPTGYTAQCATDSGFVTIVDNRNVPDEVAVFRGLKVATLYYVRVAARAGGILGDWSATSSITTASDTTPPDAPSSPAASFINGGDLIVTWAEPTSPNLRDIEIRIYDTAGGTLYAVAYSATGSYVWTAAQNLAATSGVGDPTLAVELRARGWNGLFSGVVSINATKSRPVTPSGIAHNWTSDPGTAGADFILSWATQSDAVVWQLSINGGTARTIASTTYTYTLDANSAQNGSADPTLNYSLVAIDALGQSSATPASGTATNAAPPPTAIAAIGSVNVIAVTLTASSAADVALYSLRIVKDGATQATVTTRATTALLDVSSYGSGTYQIGVTVVDAFAQSSTEMLSTGAFLEPFNLTTFRSGGQYRDSVGNSSTTLAALKDDILGAGGVSYS